MLFSSARDWKRFQSCSLGCVAALVLIGRCLLGASMAEEPVADLLKSYREGALKWEMSIQALEELDKKEVAGERALLFLGSSSIRLWETVGEDLAPWPTVRRGYGGAKFSDLAYFAPRLMAAHQPRGVVIYVGNDVVGKETDKTPEEVVRLFESVVGSVKKRAPKAHIFLIAITPAPSRFTAWPQIQATNKRLQDFCELDPMLHFISTESSYLTADGKPRPELFRNDRLHQNQDGYRLWSGIVRAELERVLGQP